VADGVFGDARYVAASFDGPELRGAAIWAAGVSCDYGLIVTNGAVEIDATYLVLGAGTSVVLGPHSHRGRGARVRWSAVIEEIIPALVEHGFVGGAVDLQETRLLRDTRGEVGP